MEPIETNLVRSNDHEDVCWLDPKELRLWRSFLSSHSFLINKLDYELRSEHGITLGEYEVLVHLSEAKDQTLRMASLAELAWVSKSGLTRRVDTLVKRGFVMRKVCPQDKRGSFAVLTPLGVIRLKQVAPTHVRGVRKYFLDRLGAIDLDDLEKYLSRLDHWE